MSDNYQAIYDAVRSRISNGNIGESVAEVARNSFDISHEKYLLQEQISITGYEATRPSVLYRPDLIKDGNAWLAIYGDLPTGCVGSGCSPYEAMADFDKQWLRSAENDKKLTPIRP